MENPALNPSSALFKRNIVLLLTLLLVALALAIYSEYWLSVLFPHPLGDDFNIYYGALESAQSGGSPYLPYVIGVSFVYHPFALTLVSVFRLFGQTAASLIWAVLNIAGYGAALWMCLRLIGETPDHSRRIAVSILFVLFAPAWEMVHIGQINGIVLACLVGSLYLSERDHPIAAGIALALAVVLKSSPVIFIPYFVITGRWRAALASLVVFAGLSLIAWMQFGSEVVLDYFTVMSKLGTETHPDFYNESAPAIILRLLAQAGMVTSETAPEIETQVALVHKLAGMALIGLTLLGAVVAPRRDQVARVWLFGLLTAIMVAASPLVWYHHNVFLMLPLMILLLANRDSEIPSSPLFNGMGLLIYFLIQIERLFEEVAPALPYVYQSPNKYLIGNLAYAGLPVLLAHVLLIGTLAAMIIMRLAHQRRAGHTPN